MADKNPVITGEQKERIKSRRRMWAIILMFLIGGVLGFTLGYADGRSIADDKNGFLTGPIPVWLAVTMAVIFIVSVLGFSAYYYKNADELEITNNLWAGAGGATGIFIAYPVWYLLWRGQILPEPSAHILFLIFYLSCTVAYTVKRYPLFAHK